MKHNKYTYNMGFMRIECAIGALRQKERENVRYVFGMIANFMALLIFYSNLIYHGHSS